MMVHRTLIRLAPAVSAPIGRCVGIGLLASSIQIAQSLFLAASLTAIATNEPMQAKRFAAAYVAAFVFRGLTFWIREQIVTAAGIQILGRLRNRLVAKLLHLGPLQLSGERTGKMQTTIVDGVEALNSYYSRYVPQLILALVVPTSLVVWLSTTAPTVALMLAVTVTAVLIVPRAWDAVLLKKGKQHWSAYQDLAADYLDSLQAISSLRVAGASAHIRTELNDRAMSLYQRTMTQLRLSLVETGIGAFLVTGGSLCAIAIAALQYDQLGASSVLMVLVIAGETFRPLRELAQHWHSGYLGLSAVDGLEELLATSPSVKDTGNAGLGKEDHPDESRTPPLIEFDSVTVTYPGRTIAALSNINLRIEPGSLVAIVGPSGAGKTTITGLLSRWQDPTVGSVRIDGVDVREFPLETLRAHVSMVFQDTYLFTGSVADNLRLAAPLAQLQELVDAATIAGVHNELAALPQGYDTILGERGATVSGGQRQRIGIARALLHNGSILVLDEPTSSVDHHTEVTISTALDRLRRDRTTVVIAHRLSTIIGADLIVVLDHGRIVEQGTHDELMRNHGTYAAMTHAQQTSATTDLVEVSHA